MTGHTGATALNAARRRRELDEISSAQLDVLVIGGGATGTGIALDAAARGLSVALVEAHDLAWGTSRFSSKLVHGGLRYLATGDLGVARESARERHLLMTRIAPHLVRPLAQLIPAHPTTSPRQLATSAAGMALGDLLRRGARTPSTVLAGWRRADAATALRLVPGLARDGLRGGVLGQDGQLVDDARLVVALARTAAGQGARILTRTRAERLRADGADLTCTLTGESLCVRARVVINATGVWTGTVDPSVRLRPSRGTHLVIPAARLGNPSAGLMVPVPGSISRFVFALPQQHGRVLIGITDEEVTGPVPDVAQPTSAEIDFLLTTVSRVLELPLHRDDVVGAFAGLRPLVDSGAGGRSADVSRRHLVQVSGATGAINVVGGKLTTYRQMAQDAVDLAVRHAHLTAGACRTRDLPLVGARPPGPAESALVARHGSEAGKVMDHPRAQNRQALLGAELNSGGTCVAAEGTTRVDITRAEIAWAITHEGALNVDDILDRRTRIGLVPADRAAHAPEVAQILADLA